MTERDLIPPTTASAALAATTPVVSWAAVFAGATSALALSILLTTLAAGFGMTLAFGGLASRGSLGGFTSILGAWMIVGQVLCGALGGYLAGRLRHRWSDAHADEVHFRDTAHGLLAWALSTVAGVVLAALVVGPYAERLSGVAGAASTGGGATLPPLDPNVMAQSSFFIAVGLLLSAFVACVAAALGGLRNEEMFTRV